MAKLRVRWFLFFLFLTLAAPQAGSKGSSVPFTSDEVMTYEVKWKAPLFFMPALHAGVTTLRVLPPIIYEGKPALHFTATAKSDGFFSKLGGIDIGDSFDSIVSTEDFCSRRIVKIQREGERKRDIALTFDPEHKNTHVLEKDISAAPPRVTRDETLPLPACAVDVLSVFYAARRFNLETGRSYNMMLSDNGVTRPITITVEKREPVDTGEGKVPAVKLRTGSAMGLFSRGGTFSIWYSDDELRVPVKFEAKVSFGKVYGWLQSYQGQGKLGAKPQAFN